MSGNAIVSAIAADNINKNSHRQNNITGQTKARLFPWLS